MRVKGQNPLRVITSRHTRCHFRVDEVFTGFALGVCGFASIVRWPPVASFESAWTGIQATYE